MSATCIPSHWNLFMHVYVCMHVWLSRVEIKHYSVAFFDRVTMFEAL